MPEPRSQAKGHAKIEDQVSPRRPVPPLTYCASKLGALTGKSMAAVMHDRSLYRSSWLEVSRPRAVLTHLGVSATFVGAACALIFFLWYPHPYFLAAGAWQVLRVLIGVDLVLGPLLTAIVFKPGKRGLKFDLAVIALVQLAAFVYGVQAIYVGRPYFTVFAVDRFYLLARGDVVPDELARHEHDRWLAKTLRGPLVVAAERPNDSAAAQRLLDETIVQGKPDIERRPDYWTPYSSSAAEVAARARPLAQLKAARPQSAAAIGALPTRLGVPEERLGFVPLIARNRDLSFIVDVTSGAPLEVLDVDPWLDDGALRAPRQPAVQP